jgi:hypothetical protein
MTTQPKSISLDADVVEKLGQVLTALKIQHVKVRRLTFDIGPSQGARHRVNIRADSRARWNKDLKITSVERI